MHNFFKVKRELLKMVETLKELGIEAKIERVDHPLHGKGFQLTISTFDPEVMEIIKKAFDALRN
jgi:hypothetical protein